MHRNRRGRRWGRTRRGQGLRAGRWGYRLAWLAGAALVCVGALLGAFGTVAWLTVLCASTFPQVVFGIVGLGILPVVGGGALLWAGLSILETQSARSRARALPDGRFVDAARGGGSPQVIAARLGIGDAIEVERRLDELVARDALAMEISEEGEVVYRTT